jgi:hypothetical protein
MAIIAVPFAHWIVQDDVTKMANYRTLSHDALLAVLHEQNQASLGSSYAGAFLLLAIVFCAVLGLGVAIERLTKFLRAG